MRFFEFKLPTPGSSFDIELKQHLLTLVSDAKNLPETDPKRIKFNQFLQNIKAEAGITEDPVADADQATINAVLAFLAKKGVEGATMWLMDGAKILGDTKVQAALQKKGEVHKSIGKETEFAAAGEIRTQLNNSASNLAKKIAGTLEAMEEAAKAELVNDPSAPKKKAPKEAEVKQDLVDLITELFSKPIAGAQTYQERDVTAGEILNFMNRCKSGIIDLVGIINSGGGNILNGLADEDTKILDMLENALLKAKPSKTAGNWGPGELGLAILGTPVHKAGKGDLQIGDMKVELKASQVATAGGRFGSKALNYGINGKSKYESALLVLMESAGYSKKTFSFDKNSPAYIGKYKTPDVQKPRSVKLGKEKIISHYNFGETFVLDVLNPKIQNKVTKAITEQFLIEVAKSCIIDSYQKTLKLKWISKAANNDGTINYTEFLMGYSAMLYSLYQQTDEVKQILVLNPLTGSFRVLNGPKDMYTATKPKGDIPHVQFGTTAIDFNDSQGKASPQIGIA
jgi:hypothetical protein